MYGALEMRRGARTIDRVVTSRYRFFFFFFAGVSVVPIALCVSGGAVFQLVPVRENRPAVLRRKKERGENRIVFGAIRRYVLAREYHSCRRLAARSGGVGFRRFSFSRLA